MNDSYYLQSQIADLKEKQKNTAVAIKLLEKEEREAVANEFLATRVLSKVLWNFRLVNPHLPNSSVSSETDRNGDKTIISAWRKLENRQINLMDSLVVQGDPSFRKKNYALLRRASDGSIQLNFPNLDVFNQFVMENDLTGKREWLDKK